ncbi:MAG: DUF2461 domain-containing protein [SAR324 cluster bacterium]|nr:DUF2461 domain-containing protein [SAR324 cluster bacterium]
MAGKAHFSPALFKFFRELRKNNERGWFQAHKQRYESEVRDPLLRFISDFAPLLEKISPNFLADPRPVGGSMFRIYRDTRFRKDKSPYKTAAGIQFRHESGKDVHAPGFYLHLGPGEVFAGTGLWKPDSPTAGKIRDAIVAKPAAWRRASSHDTLRGICNLEGETLKRPPRGYDPQHPLIEDLKRKDFLAMTRFSEKEACGGDFLQRFAEVCRTAAPFTRFLTTAVGLPW